MKKIVIFTILALIFFSFAGCSKKCTECYGLGYEICPWMDASHVDCSVCAGGRVECITCNGTGRIK